MKKITLIVTAFLFAICFTMPVTSLAQDGSLDLSFGSGGIAQTHIIGSAYSYAKSMAIQSDGKIVTVGMNNNSYSFLTLVRYNTNGSLDTTFDADGIATIGIWSYGYSVAIQSDGKIVVAGQRIHTQYYNDDFLLVRYNTNGSLDNTFGSGGIVTTNIGNNPSAAFSVAIQSDGKIVAGGGGWENNAGGFALVRYNTNGSLDITFDTDGIVTTSISYQGGMVYSIAIQSDGKIVAGGVAANIYPNSDFALARYNTNGSLDVTFDSDGKVYTPIGIAQDIAYSIAIQSDGKIVAGGVCDNGTNKDFALVRYNTNGSLDNTFDSDGKVTTPIGTADDIAYSIAIQSDGKVLAGGIYYSATPEFALVRYNTNGSLDNTFDSDGIVTTYLGNAGGQVNSIAIQSDGKIVAAGMGTNNSTNVFTIARYNNCQLSITSTTTAATICIGASTTITASGAATYTWMPGNLTGATITVSPTTTTTYIVTGTDANSCSNTATSTITVNPLPIVTAISSTAVVCAGSSVTLTGAGASTYSWDNNVTDAVSFVPTATTTYILTGTDSIGCSNTAMITVTVNALPVASLGPDLSQCGSPVILDAGNIGSIYLWSNASTTQTITVSNSGTYIVVVTNVNGCIGSDTVVITINALPTLMILASSQVYCTTDLPGSLSANPTGGVWTGPGVVGNSFDPLVAGFGLHTVMYSYTDNNSCTNTATLIMTVNICAGINEIADRILLSVFPNPFSTSTTLQSVNTFKDATLTVYNLYGQEVKHLNNLSGQTIILNRDNLPQGLYFIQLTENNKTISVEKLVITD